MWYESVQHYESNVKHFFLYNHLAEAYPAHIGLTKTWAIQNAHFLRSHRQFGNLGNGWTEQDHLGQTQKVNSLMYLLINDEFVLQVCLFWSLRTREVYEKQVNSTCISVKVHESHELTSHFTSPFNPKLSWVSGKLAYAYSHVLQQKAQLNCWPEGIHCINIDQAHTIASIPTKVNTENKFSHGWTRPA